MVANALVGIGLSLEFLGVLLMTNAYINNVSLFSLPFKLLRSLFSKEYANTWATFNDLNTGKGHLVLKGIACILLGFITQFSSLFF